MMHSLLILLLTTAPDCTRVLQCKQHDEMAAMLYQCAKESPVRMGINKDRNLTETYASLKGTWTDVVTSMITGISCVTDFGINHHGRPVPKPEQGA